MRRLHLVIALASLCACRIERVAPGGGAATSSCESTPRGEVWVYTSVYRNVLDKLEPLIAQRLPEVKVQWFQAGGEKLQARLEAEIAAGGIQADVLMASDPFLYERFKEEGLLAPYASVHALKLARSMSDPDANYVPARVSTMVLVVRSEMEHPPKSFRELTNARYRGRVAIGDPLSSGTATNWAFFMSRAYGMGYFGELRANRVVVAGGNAAVLQKVESGEADAGVLLLENALVARGNGSRITIVYPEDGAVVIPGHIATFASARNPVAARAFIDLMLSPEGQQAIVTLGDMHAADARIPGPRDQPPLDTVLAQARPWSDTLLREGVAAVPAMKKAFSEAFAR
jgi:iron(III) transport system substrate-binding protein